MVKVQVERLKQKVMAQSSSSRPDPPQPSAKLASRKQSMVKVLVEHVKQKVMAQSSSSRPDPPRPSAKLASRKQSMVKVEQPEQPEKKPLPLMISPERPQSVGVNVGIWPPRPVMRRPPDGELKMATVSEGCE